MSEERRESQGVEERRSLILEISALLYLAFIPSAFQSNHVILPPVSTSDHNSILLFVSLPHLLSFLKLNHLDAASGYTGLWLKECPSGKSGWDQR